MTKQQLLVRKTYCETKGLCFVSLKPRLNPRVQEHSEVGLVMVNEEFIKY